MSNKQLIECKQYLDEALEARKLVNERLIQAESLLDLAHQERQIAKKLRRDALIFLILGFLTLALAIFIQLSGA